MLPLSKKYEEALVFAFNLHVNQVRKVNSVPYISHLLSVSALILEHGGDEEEAIAGLLHDAVEDQGGLPVLRYIEQNFGQRVADIVDGCTDAYVIPKPPWRQRKEAYLKKMESHSPAVRRVSLADKLHNARSLLSLLREGDGSVWEKFNGGKDGSLWYLQALNEKFQVTGSDNMTDEYNRVVTDIIALCT